MNTKASVAYGWVAYTVAGVGGAFLGYQVYKSKSGERQKVWEEAKARNEQAIAEFRAEMKLQNQQEEGQNKPKMPSSEASKDFAHSR
mmetsp:Transcript_2935/g.3709  ORF Transcript_2935/g.3709 Transcript_2935/m.3709 type:complete len:87 (+) Transcript_2935:178-438(+)|eukprot:CAMPEP_0204849442 /NCGR_PEP_ID=MMETSP1347-20130617/6313_1 /ASSEMBLY_ACC=CAM_ASM_000690 /TAXON_ID=215587 /ORGANISM="Aplanochytrium stocchinoi, Strain GSBS06" /LENGTH=86 /DNA_ID=CAMNT_0051991783 /DNA_START=45 /DNA_END=308 /DNA_ORIENTATION=-